MRGVARGGARWAAKTHAMCACVCARACVCACVCGGPRIYVLRAPQLCGGRIEIAHDVMCGRPLPGLVRRGVSGRGS